MQFHVLLRRSALARLLQGSAGRAPPQAGSARGQRPGARWLGPGSPQSL